MEFARPFASTNSSMETPASALDRLMWRLQTMPRYVHSSRTSILRWFMCCLPAYAPCFSFQSLVTAAKSRLLHAAAIGVVPTVSTSFAALAAICAIAMRSAAADALTERPSAAPVAATAVPIRSAATMGVVLRTRILRGWQILSQGHALRESEF